MLSYMCACEIKQLHNYIYIYIYNIIYTIYISGFVPILGFAWRLYLRYQILQAVKLPIYIYIPIPIPHLYSLTFMAHRAIPMITGPSL